MILKRLHLLLNTVVGLKNGSQIIASPKAASLHSSINNGHKQDGDAASSHTSQGKVHLDHCDDKTLKVSDLKKIKSSTLVMKSSLTNSERKLLVTNS